MNPRVARNRRVGAQLLRGDKSRWEGCVPLPNNASARKIGAIYLSSETAPYKSLLCVVCICWARNVGNPTWRGCGEWGYGDIASVRNVPVNVAISPIYGTGGIPVWRYGSSLLYGRLPFGGFIDSPY